jgi:hypothetical protein
MDGRTAGWTDGWMDGRLDGRMAGRTDGWLWWALLPRSDVLRTSTPPNLLKSHVSTGRPSKSQVPQFEPKACQLQQQMAQQIICALNNLVNRHKDQPHFEPQFDTSIKIILVKEGSGSTQRRKQRAVRLLSVIRSKINEAVFVCCVSGIGYTVLADVNNVDDITEKLLVWWTEGKDMEHLSRYATELFHNKLETVNELFSKFQIQQEERQVISQNIPSTPPNLTGGHDRSNRNTSIVTAQMQQKERQVVPQNNAPEPSELTEGLDVSNFNTDTSAPSELTGGLDNLSSNTQGIGLITQSDHFEGGTALAEGIVIAWPTLLAIFVELGQSDATAQYFYLNSNNYGFRILLGPVIVAVVQMSQNISSYTINALLRATETSY